MSESPVALITGSGKKRVGWHVAQALGQRGFHIILHYNSSEKEAHQSVEEFISQGISARAIQADISDEQSVNNLIESIKQDEGRLDVLVCCASIYPSKSLEDTTAEDLQKNFTVNTLGTFLCCQQAGLMMCQQAEGGCIVTLGDWAIQRPYLDHAAYFVSKGAIPTLTRCLAVELASRNPNVRVNCIHPGPVMFPESMSEAEREKVKEATLIKKADQPQTIAQAVLALIDNEFITGTCLPVDGGRSIFAPTEN